MASPFSHNDEPVTPTGRLFLRPELNTVIHCAFGVRNDINISVAKSCIASSLMVQLPRFRSLLVIDKHGVEHWRPTEMDIDRHFIVVQNNENNNNEDDASVTRFINDYIAEMSVSSPLSTDKPLWEIHLLMAQKCMVFRFHHALGDGISLMSLCLADCNKEKDPGAAPPPAAPKIRKRGWVEAIVGLFYSLIFCVKMVLRGLWVRDRKTVISGGDGVELWPRKMATARFLIDDMKVVKNAVSNATINDVLFGVISAGLSRYLDHHSPEPLKEGTQITGVAIVNARPHPGLQELSEMMKRSSKLPWGNKLGMLLLPVYYCKSGVDSLRYVRRAKKMIDKKKGSFEAQFVSKIVDLLMSLLGPQVASFFNYRVLCNTTFTISNVVGPKEEICIARNPATFIRVNTSSLPHALTMHMTSYEGRADLQILVAKDIIADPEFLAKCFEDALLEMRQEAAAAV